MPQREMLLTRQLCSEFILKQPCWQRTSDTQLSTTTSSFVPLAPQPAGRKSEGLKVVTAALSKGSSRSLGSWCTRNLNVNHWMNFPSDTSTPVQLKIRRFGEEQREARRVCPQLADITAHREQQRDPASLKPCELCACSHPLVPWESTRGHISSWPGSRSCSHSINAHSTVPKEQP